MDLKVFYNLTELSFKPKHYFFNRLRPPLGYHSKVQSGRMDLKTHFGSFHPIARKNPTFFFLLFP